MARQDERRPFAVALAAAREAAYPPGEYVGQESFMRAGEIRELASRAGVVPGSSVLDLCCGVAGPGRLITSELGCSYLGVDYSASALGIAAELAGDLPCHFEQAHIPPLPAGRFDVVLLLETMLAFPDKRALLQEVARALVSRGRFTCTVEEGPPLTPGERGRMPDSDTVWLVPLGELTAHLREVGFAVVWQRDWTAAHAATATALLTSYCAHAERIREQIGERACGDLIDAHQLWAEWLSSGRVRKYALVAEKL